jgi:iron complex transport system permease protein
MESRDIKHLDLKKVTIVTSLMLLLLLACLILSLNIGASSIDIISAISGDPSKSPDLAILLQHRIPRTLLAALVGASLSVTGAALQAFLRNPLADPYIIGVSGGAALGGTVAIIMGIGAFAFSGVSAFAFIGSMAATFIIFSLSTGRGRFSNYEILLIGVVFNSFAAAIIMFLKTIVKSEKTLELLLWLMGSLTAEGTGMGKILILTVIFSTGFLLLYGNANYLNALSLGEEHAESLGVDPSRLKKIVFIAASLLVSGAVSLTGMIGFVGLVVPHGVRLITGPDNRILLPVCAIAGSIFLVLSDIVARLLFPIFTTETPVGVITAFIGAPVFVYLLKVSKKSFI